MQWIPLGRHNPRVSELRAIARGDRENLTLVDGRKLVEDLLKKGFSPVAVFASPAVAEALGRATLWLHSTKHSSCFTLAEEVLNQLAPTKHTQGVLAVFPIPSYQSIAGPLLLYLDRIQDPANVGAIMRVAAAFGVSGVACSPGTADPFSPKAIRASAGHAFSLPVMRRLDWATFRQRVAAVHRVVAATATGGCDGFAWQPSLPMVLVLGNEGQGLSPEIDDAVDQRVTIPLERGVESLNVAVACGILLARLRGLEPGPILGNEGGSHDSTQRY